MNNKIKKYLSNKIFLSISCLFVILIISMILIKKNFSKWTFIKNSIYVQLNNGRLLDFKNVVFQKENECGIAALVMIFNAFNINLEICYLRNKINISNIGVSAYELKKLAEEEGILLKAFRGDWSFLLSCQKPLIALINDEHFVVVDEVDSSQIIIRDPSLGRLRYPKNKWLEMWDGLVLTFNKS